MDVIHSNTVSLKRKRGSHLNEAARAVIWIERKNGKSCRAIAKILNCSPQTICNELKRGTPERKGRRGRKPGYSFEYGQRVYEENRRKCRIPHKLKDCGTFIAWVDRLFRKEEWSFDACVGAARRHSLFPPEKMLCTTTLYSECKAGRLPIAYTDLPQAASRRERRKHQEPAPPKQNKKVYGTSIEERPAIVAEKEEFGHWEGDTVVGLKAGKNSVIFTLLEKKTRMYLICKIQSKTSSAVLAAMASLKEQFGSDFSRVFKSITVDNGSEFAEFAKVKSMGVKAYFTHPYTSCERGQNERHNQMLRKFIPKGKPIDSYSTKYIFAAMDKINRMPRKILNYRSPFELYSRELRSMGILVLN